MSVLNANLCKQYVKFEQSVLNGTFTNSIDQDQTPLTSDLGLYCLQRSHLWNARHKLVNLYLHGMSPSILYQNRFVINSLIRHMRSEKTDQSAHQSD